MVVVVVDDVRNREPPFLEMSGFFEYNRRKKKNIFIYKFFRLLYILQKMKMQRQIPTKFFEQKNILKLSLKLACLLIFFSKN